ncbi:ABC transporter ATP-binding protein [Fusibacter tunisiensis]|jgi:ABC-2 type transport system ATP-binding protein|uniref:ABC-2 type transport system ATP-binding protein n=1 Tax=Fusibacter tunisiensis TaxID=1008308 RepID=A0ABS2MSS3_9FIRM|nr:ABC transporter ATP-binding protein [Fusibacter tunisiensis]MBM7562481.1 ABC-2 type transport system ATP-binding protein [Fusibacter tunisiensis]
MLELKGLTKVFGKEKVAVNHLDLSIEQGEIFGFIGPNGAGKTTTLRMITGIIAPSEGDVTIGGKSIRTDAIEAKQQFTFVPDQSQIYDAIKGIDYLNFIADMYEVSSAERKDRIERYTKLFQIDDALFQTVNSYSHGMRQKLMICGALLPNPKLFILDEPHVGLDPHSNKILKDLMREHCANGGTVLFSSHVLEVVENLCDRVAIIHKGKLIACDTLDNVKRHSSATLEEIFLEMTKDE